MHLSINFVTAAAGVSESPALYAATIGVLTAAAVVVALASARGRLRGLRQKHEYGRHAAIHAGLLIQR
jgi:hypothetical protein